MSELTPRGKGNFFCPLSRSVGGVRTTYKTDGGAPEQELAVIRGRSGHSRRNFEIQDCGEDQAPKLGNLLVVIYIARLWCRKERAAPGLRKTEASPD
jgi:hypothetical protein